MSDPTSERGAGRRPRPPFERVSGEGTTAPGIPVALAPARWDAIVRELEAREVSGTPVLVAATAVTWTSGALGCPQPGRSYTQALVQGVRALVEVGGVTYDYRFGRGDVPRLCES